MLDEPAVTGSFTVASVTISATKLRLTYMAASSTFTMAGTAKVDIKKLGFLSVTFGNGSGWMTSDWRSMNDQIASAPITMTSARIGTYQTMCFHCTSAS